MTLPSSVNVCPVQPNREGAQQWHSGQSDRFPWLETARATRPGRAVRALHSLGAPHCTGQILLEFTVTMLNSASYAGTLETQRKQHAPPVLLPMIPVGDCWVAVVGGNVTQCAYQTFPELGPHCLAQHQPIKHHPYVSRPLTGFSCKNHGRSDHQACFRVRRLCPVQSTSARFSQTGQVRSRGIPVSQTVSPAARLLAPRGGGGKSARALRPAPPIAPVRFFSSSQ